MPWMRKQPSLCPQELGVCTAGWTNYNFSLICDSVQCSIQDVLAATPVIR